MRVAANRPATLRFHLVDEGGTVVNPDAGHNPTVTVTAGDGTTVLYTAQPSTFNATDGAWEWVMPPQAQLDSLMAAWSTQVGGVAWTESDPVDVVGGRLAEPWLLRLDPDIAAANLSTLSLMVACDQAEEDVREALGYAPVLEGVRISWDELRGTLNDALYVSGTVNGLPYGWGAGRMRIPGYRFPQQVYAGSINGVALDPVNDIPNIQVQAGKLVWSDYRPWISGRYSMWFTHGLANPPRDLRWACGRMVRHAVLTTGPTYPDRAWQVQTEGATIMFSSPGPDRPTGIPEVDAVLNRYRRVAWV